MNIAFAGLRHGHIFGLYQKARSMDGVTVVGSWEADDAARAAAQTTITEPFYDSYEALLADERVDAIAVGDYYGKRGQLIIRALKAGKHVIADKPICTSLSELDEIERLSKERKLCVSCMLDLRYDLASLLHDNRIADPDISLGYKVLIMERRIGNGRACEADRFDHGFRNRFHHIGFNDPRCDSIDTDALWS